MKFIKAGLLSLAGATALMPASIASGQQGRAVQSAARTANIVGKPADAPMDGDDGTEIGAVTYLRDGTPMDAARVGRRREIHDCLLSLSGMIPKDEIEDYAKTVSYFAPHRLSVTEDLWIQDRALQADIELGNTGYEIVIGDVKLQPFKVSKALNVCMVLKAKT